MTKLKRVSFLSILKLLSTHTAIHTTITLLYHTHMVLPCSATLAGWLAGYLDDFLAGTCFEASLFRWGVCWQLRIFLALPYIYNVD